MTSMDDLDDVFELDDMFYIIKKMSYESRETHNERGRFILKELKKDKTLDLNRLIVLSKVMANKKTLGCKYSSSLMEKVSLAT